jgi:molybdopterin-synthase adenylyltransferase
MNTNDRFPRTKPIYPRYWESEQDGLIHVGAQRGGTRAIRDPHRHIWELMDLLDGSRNADDVTATMVARHPEIAAEEVCQAIGALDESGLLDDGRPSKYDEDPKYSRYVANVNYFSNFSRSTHQRGGLQDILGETRVALLGLGGTGSTVLQLLLGAGIGKLRAADFDRVEPSNLNRQLIFEESSIGCLKTDAARYYAERRNSLVDYDFVTARLEDVSAVSEIVNGSDIVVSAIDEPRGLVDRLVNKACVINNIPCVYGATQVSRGRVFVVLPFQSGCVDCLWLHYGHVDKSFVSRFRTLIELGFRAPSMAYAPNIMRLCAEMVDELVRVRTGYLPPRAVGVQLEPNYETGGVVVMNEWAWERDENCPTCGGGNEEDFAEWLGVPPLRVREPVMSA